MKNKNPSLIIAIIIILILFIGCYIWLHFYSIEHNYCMPFVDCAPLSGKQLNVNGVLINYNDYLNKEIVLDGKFGGYGVPENCNLNLTGTITRSDTIFYDDTGCIAIYAKSNSPKEYTSYEIGSPLKIRARVILDPEGKPLLNVLERFSK